VAGVAVAVVHGGDTLLHKGFGRADVELEVPTPRDAVYEIGSITKQFTAAAILQLAAKDSINLDAPITAYLPAYNTRGHTVTVRHLLHHTSGIRSYTNMAQFQDIAYQELPRDTLLALVGAEPLRFAPGTAMSYSNTGYFLLGRIIEKASGQSYAAYIEEHLFGPVGMEDSYYCDEQAVVEHRAHGYRWSGSDGFQHKEYLDHTWPYAAGSLCSTTGDLVAWNRALHGGAVLSDSMYQRMVSPGRLSDGTHLRHAMGLGVFEIEGRPVIAHGGGIPGYLSHARYYPEEDLIVIVLQNTASPRGPSSLTDSLAHLVLGPGEEPETRSYGGDLSTLAGRYSGPAGGGLLTLQVQAEGEHLLASRAGSGAEADTLRHVSGLTWRLGTSRYRFVRVGEQIVELRLDVVYGHYVLRRIGEP
jgi:CubicO group peptidase (beta-lactamase class C family)